MVTLTTLDKKIKNNLWSIHRHQGKSSAIRAMSKRLSLDVLVYFTVCCRFFSPFSHIYNKIFLYCRSVERAHFEIFWKNDEIVCIPCRRRLVYRQNIISQLCTISSYRIQLISFPLKTCLSQHSRVATIYLLEKKLLLECY